LLLLCALLPTAGLPMEEMAAAALNPDGDLQKAASAAAWHGMAWHGMAWLAVDAAVFAQKTE
jgi:hypothetical protein